MANLCTLSTEIVPILPSESLVANEKTVVGGAVLWPRGVQTFINVNWVLVRVGPPPRKRGSVEEKNRQKSTDELMLDSGFVAEKLWEMF